MQTIKTILFRFPSINFFILADNFLKKVFIKKTINHFEKLNKPYGIIINDDMLKFHNNDLRKQISKKLI